MGVVTHSNLEDVFTHHKPKGDFQIEKYHRLRMAARGAAKTILDEPGDQDKQLAAIEGFAVVIKAETGHCRDRDEALGVLQAAAAFVQGAGAAMLGQDINEPDVAAEAGQQVISCIRCAVMWANASVALEGRI